MHRLSSNFKPLIRLIILIIIVLCAGWLNALRLNLIGIKKDGLIELPIIILIGLCLLILIKRIKKIDFDTNFIYISDRGVKEIIPFENIIKLKLIMIEIGTVDFYKMLYETKEGESKSVRFLPSVYFIEFLRILKEKNKNVKIQNMSHSFDLDI